MWEMGFPSDGKVGISTRTSKACAVTWGLKNCGQVLGTMTVWCVPKNVNLCKIMEWYLDSFIPCPIPPPPHLPSKNTEVTSATLCIFAISLGCVSALNSVFFHFKCAGSSIQNTGVFSQ